MYLVFIPLYPVGNNTDSTVLYYMNLLILILFIILTLLFTQVPPVNTWNGIPREFLVSYGNTTERVKTSLKELQEGSNGSDTLEVKLNGLQPHRNYSAMVAICTAVGCKWASNELCIINSMPSDEVNTKGLWNLNYYRYILKRWIVLKPRSDWLTKLWIYFAIHLRATRRICARKYCNRCWNKYTIPSHCFSISQNNYSPQCRWVAVVIYLAASPPPLWWVVV